jgi:hypothetical protein
MIASGQQNPEMPFQARGDRGELVQILPPPAAVQARPDIASAAAPASSGAQVFKASYGSGNLLYHKGGTVMSLTAFWPIFWNGDVAGAGGSQGYATISAQISAFTTAFLNGLSSYSGSKTDDFTIVAQYRDSAGHDPVPTAAPSLFGPFTDSQAAPASISDSQIQQYLAGLFTNSATTGVVPQSNVLYGVYFPHGVTVKLGTAASCSNFCGYHSSFNYNGTIIKYAVFPFPDCSGCSLTGLQPGDMFTIVSSHEIREAATDPLGNAWFDRRGYEADDKCAWHNLYQMVRNNAATFWVQPEYSNGGTVNGITYPGPGCVVP